MKLSLRGKLTLFTLVMATILAIVACIISYRVYTSTIDDHYDSLALNLSKTLVTSVDKKGIRVIRDKVLSVYREICDENGGEAPFGSFTQEDWEAYFEKYKVVEQLPEYQALLAQLQQYSEDNQTDSIYIGYTDMQTGYGIYLIDGSIRNNASPVGTADKAESAVIEEISKGNYGFPPNITNYPQYGWLCSVGEGIYDADGEVLGTLCVDISLDEVRNDGYNFLATLVLVMALIAVLLILVIAVVINKIIVAPIKLLDKASASFVSEKQSGDADGASGISQLDIHTGDEIEHLCKSIKKMELDINTYISDLTRVTAEQERIGAELDVATKIQSDMLPCIFPAFPDRREFDIYASMNPAKEVGGDFYDFFLIDKDHIAMVIADVSGKGVPAALFMVIAKALIKNSALGGDRPAVIFENVNNQLCENNEAEMFVTAWIGILDISTGKMICANAGHEFPAICKKNGEYQLFKDRHGFVLGGLENSKYKEYDISFEPGDRLFVYTDGVPEATNSKDELFDTKRMIAALNQNPKASPEDTLKQIKIHVDEFVGGAPQFDDLTMMSFLYYGKDG